MLFNFKLTILLLGIVVSVIWILVIWVYASDNLDSYAPYKGFKVYSISIASRYEVDFLYNISLNNKAIDMWLFTKIPNSIAQAMVSPEHQQQFENKLKLNGMHFKFINPEILKINLSKKLRNDNTGKMDIFKKFLRHSEINAYLEDLEVKYYNRVSVKTIGYSYEKRPIKSITITNGKSNFKDKKVIFIDAGIHAREWIAPSTALYVIEQLVKNCDKNKHLLEHYDWIVIPLINPDGYEYSHTNDRYWRKNRKPSSSICCGTDINRNFDYHWSEDGGSSDACNDRYKGDKPFSEPETQAIRDVLLSLHGRGKMYLSLHSFGRLLLYPWGYTSKLPENWRDINEVAEAGANAIKNYTNETYTVGSATNVLYRAAGNSIDYALGVAKFTIAISMELPPTSDLIGFRLEPSEIESTVKESWIGIETMVENVIRKY